MGTVHGTGGCCHAVWPHKEALGAQRVFQLQTRGMEAQLAVPFFPEGPSPGRGHGRVSATAGKAAEAGPCLGAGTWAFPGTCLQKGAAFAHAHMRPLDCQNASPLRSAEAEQRWGGQPSLPHRGCNSGAEPFLGMQRVPTSNFIAGRDGCAFELV